MITFLELTALLAINADAPFKCGQENSYSRPYGRVKAIVDCRDVRTHNSITICERKGDLFHGSCQHFDSLWRKKDSTFYLNDEEHGTSLVWDSSGNVVGKSQMKKGIPVGKHEAYYAPGKPASIKHYNDSGEVHGTQQEWWPNGQKKLEAEARRNQIISATEYYPTGKPRMQYRIKEEPKAVAIMEMRHIEGQAWAPDGRPAGGIAKGNGVWLQFPKEDDGKPPVIFREVYKDSLLKDVEQLDSARAKRFVDSLARARGSVPRKAGP